MLSSDDVMRACDLRRPRTIAQYKAKLCSFFTQTGECSKGERCNFAHDKAELRETPVLMVRGPTTQSGRQSTASPEGEGKRGGQAESRARSVMKAAEASPAMPPSRASDAPPQQNIGGQQHALGAPRLWPQSPKEPASSDFPRRRRMPGATVEQPLTAMQQAAKFPSPTPNNLPPKAYKESPAMSLDTSYAPQGKLGGQHPHVFAATGLWPQVLAEPAVDEFKIKALDGWFERAPFPSEAYAGKLRPGDGQLGTQTIGTWHLQLQQGCVAEVHIFRF